MPTNWTTQKKWMNSQKKKIYIYISTMKTKSGRHRKFDQITSNKIELVIKKFPTNKAQDQKASQVKSAKFLKNS